MFLSSDSPFFQLAEIEMNIVQFQIGKVLFDRCVDILFSLNFISDNTVNQERITKATDVSFISPVRMFENSSNSTRLCTLYLPIISEI